MKISKGVNVLMLGSDMNILKDGSEPNQRMKDYGRLVNRLDIAIYNGKIFGISDDAYEISHNVFAYPRSFLGLLSLFHVNTQKLSFVLNHKIDMVTSQDPFVLGYISYSLAKWLRAPLHIQIHTDIFSPYFKRESFYNRVKVFMARRLLPKSNGIRVVSKRILDSLKREVAIKIEPFLLPVRVDIDFIKENKITVGIKENYPQFDTFFLMASRMTIEKNITMAITAMKNVVKRFPKTGLIIVGEGPMYNYLQSLIRSYGLAENIILEKWSDDLVSYYKTGDLFINTSNYEGYGRTIVEALSAGMPVLTTDVGCAREMIIQGKNGFIIPVAGKKELSSAMIEFLGDNELRKRVKDGAKQTKVPVLSKDEYLEMYARSWNDCLR